jgi:hypothetical protein
LVGVTNQSSAWGKRDTIAKAMIPVGYMAKRVVTAPTWLAADRISSIYSVSGCMSEYFADYIGFWKHNDYWLFDSPEAIAELARENDIDLAATVLFFYELHELQFDSGEWTHFAVDASVGNHVIVPGVRVLEGYDVVTFSVQSSPECSPLSCNALAAEVETNDHCLLHSFDQARTLLEHGTFTNSEPGPYRIFAVYSVGWPVALRLQQ